MRIKCSKCGCDVNISIFELIRKIVMHEDIYCDKCAKVVSYEQQAYEIPYLTWVNNNTCVIGQFKPEIYEWINKNKGKYCVFLRNDDTYECATLLGEESGQIRFENTKNFSIPVYDLKRIELIDRNDRRYLPMDGSSIIGYKGINVQDGIMGDKKYIYEFEIPYEEEYRNPFHTDYQDVYSHFCTSIEDVLFWRNYIIDAVNNKEKGTNFPEYRLFKVKAGGHYFKNSEKGWVSNNLTVMEEIKPQEIIDYFQKDASKMKVLLEYVSHDTWNKYINLKIDSFKNEFDEEEAIAVCVKSSLLYCTSECKATSDIRECKKCQKKDYCPGAISYDHFCYLKVKILIKDGKDYKGTDEYQHLKTNNKSRELAGIERLLRFYK